MNAEDVKFITESGLLFEVNRRVLHPLGLELGFLAGVFGGDLTSRATLSRCTSPEGIIYEEADLEDGFRRLRAFMKREGYQRLAARYERRGFRSQIPASALDVFRSDPNADERDWTVPRRELTAAVRDVVEAARELLSEVEDEPLAFMGGPGGPAIDLRAALEALDALREGKDDE
jgi:hypothetical protein